MLSTYLSLLGFVIRNRNFVQEWTYWNERVFAFAIADAMIIRTERDACK